MALTPMIVIGCGGSGSKVVVGLRQRLEVELRRLGWDEGIPRAWQLLSVDTPGAQETNMEFGPPLPSADYISTSSQQQVYAPIDYSVSSHASNQQALDRLVGWRPPPELNVPVANGAGQWRAVGRTVAFSGLDRFAKRFKSGLSSCIGGQAQLQRLGELVGDPAMPGTTPFVVVISSMAGGTGAGIFMDICDVARVVEPDLQDRIMSVLFTAEVFQNLRGGSGFQPNTVAVLSELMAGYFDRDRQAERLYTGIVDEQQDALMSSGPSYPFVVGMQTLSGQPLTEISQSYRAVTETLAAALMSPSVYKDLLEFQITNWSNNAMPNKTKWEFGNPSFAGGQLQSGGMVSSFGSSRLSVGSKLFGEYAVHRLTREVIEFLIDGHLDEGRELLQDKNATQDEVISHFRSSRGLQFVSDCGLREVDLPDQAHTQVVDAVRSEPEIQRECSQWWMLLKSELAEHGDLGKTQWMQAIQQTVPNRLRKVMIDVDREVDRNIEELAVELPARIVEETSRVMSELGVAVARSLLEYASVHIGEASSQLIMQAQEEKLAAEHWTDMAGRALAELGKNDKVSVGHGLIGGDNGAIKKATVLGYRTIRSSVYSRTADFLRELQDQVLRPLVAQLDQVLEALSNSEIRTEISKFPSDSGVPTRFSPTPFDFCLVEVDEWPELFKSLVRETTQREKEEFRGVDSAATLRRMIGGGGFTVDQDGRDKQIASAISLSAEWSRGRSIHFTTYLTVADITERARDWVGRNDVAIGTFIDEDLNSYLSPTDRDGLPRREFPQRLAKFQDQLSAALNAATPLIAIDPNVFSRVHPNSTMAQSMTTLDVEPLPVGGQAREVAEKVIAPVAQQHSTKQLADFFDDGTTSSESVLIVSQLAGAVHPSAVMSLTQPINSAWQSTKVSPAMINGFWQFRRARILPEAVPVSPGVLQSMIKGWFLGRAFGLIDNPSVSDGFSIGSPRGRKRFPWPLLRCGHLDQGLANQTHQWDWLPAILETLGLAYMLVPTEPGVLDAYDELFLLGRDGEVHMDKWMSSGTIDGAICNPRVPHSGANETTFDALHSALVKNKKAIAERHAGTNLSADASEFFRVDFGHALYPNIVAALSELISEIPRPSDGEMLL